MPLTGEAKVEHNRQAYLKRKLERMTLRPREMRVIEGIAEGKTAVQALRDAGMSPTNGTLKARLAPSGDLAQGLKVLLEQRGLTLDRVVKKVEGKLDSTRHQTVGGVAIEADDNDAQLRAVEIGIRLHERAGTIPAPAGGNGGGTTINVFEVVYAPQIADPRLIHALDAAPDADPRVIDAQVLDSSDDA